MVVEAKLIILRDIAEPNTVQTGAWAALLNSLELAPVFDTELAGFEHVLNDIYQSQMNSAGSC